MATSIRLTFMLFGALVHLSAWHRQGFASVGHASRGNSVVVSHCLSSSVIKLLYEKRGAYSTFARGKRHDGHFKKLRTRA